MQIGNHFSSSSSSSSASAAAPSSFLPVISQDQHIKSVVATVLKINPELQSDLFTFAVHTISNNPQLPTERGTLLSSLLSNFLLKVNEFNSLIFQQSIQFLLGEIKEAEIERKQKQEQEALDLIYGFKKIYNLLPQGAIYNEDKNRFSVIYSSLQEKYEVITKASEINAFLNEDRNQKILSQITHLDLSKSKLHSFPPCFCNLRGLTSLLLAENHLTKLPAEMGKLRSLRLIYLANNQLTSLPKELPLSLTFIDLSHNSLTEVPTSLSKLINLTGLFINDNPLRELPNALQSLQKLEKLNLGKNQFTVFPSIIFTLPHLNHLSLVEMGLTDLPEELAQLQKIKGLNLSNNKFSTVPTVIFKLENLLVLNLSSNKLTLINWDCSALPKLKILNLAHNRLAYPPAEFQKTASLELVDFTGNPMIGLPAEVLIFTHPVYNSDEINTLRKKYAIMRKQIADQAAPLNISNSSSSLELVGPTLSTASSIGTEEPLPPVLLEFSEGLHPHSHSSASSSSSSSSSASAQSLAVSLLPSSSASSSTQISSLHPSSITVAQNVDEELTNAIKVIATKVLGFSEPFLSAAAPTILENISSPESRQRVLNRMICRLTFNQCREIDISSLGILQLLSKGYRTQQLIDEFEASQLSLCFERIVIQLTTFPEMAVILSQFKALSREPPTLKADPILQVLNNPAYQSYFDTIVELDLSNCQLATLPQIVCHRLRNLQKLDLSKNNLVTLSSEIILLKNLRILRLNSNQIHILPVELPRSLQILDLAKNNLIEVPAQISTLTGLRSLNLSENQLTFLPVTFSHLRQLTDLFLDHNNFNQFPLALTDLNVINLSMAYNKLSALSPLLNKELLILNLRGNHLCEIPPEIFSCGKLQGLDLAFNQIVSIPAEISRLQELRLLKVSNNRLTTLPPGLSQLKSLTYFSWANNNLQAIPPELVYSPHPAFHQFRQYYEQHFVTHASSVPPAASKKRKMPASPEEKE